MPTARNGYVLADGTKVPSVTTICGGLGWSSGALQYWAWDLGRQGFDYKALREQTASVGTVVHDRIHQHLLGLPWNSDEYDPEMIAASDAPFEQYLAWRKGKTIEVVLAEKNLVSERLRYGGTPDFLVLLDGKLTLIDLKTSKGLYPSHIAQVAAYCELIEDVEDDLIQQHNPGRWIENVIVLQCNRDGDAFRDHQIDEETLLRGWKIFWNLFDIHGEKAPLEAFCEATKPPKPEKEKKPRKKKEVKGADSTD